MIVGSVATAVAAVKPPAQSKVVTDVSAQFKRMGTSNASSFCYAVEDGKIQGVNPEKPVRIASVMKLLTTFWAVESLGPNYRYTTKIYYQASNKEMHIEGSRDPFFDRDRLYLLLADLNKAGIKEVTRLTADKKFWINYDVTEYQYLLSYAHGESYAAQALGDDNIKAKLDEGFNTSNWWASKASRYKQIRVRNASPALPTSLAFKADATDVVESNPLAGKPGVTVFEIKSAPLRSYLKQMNIVSVNPLADELFHSLGGEDSFQSFMSAKYGMGDEVDGVHTGSGLPLRNPRLDTTVSCSTVVRMVRRMDADLESKYKLDLADVMMVAGIDRQQGATHNDGSKSLLVKTGTVNGASNFAGVEETTTGEVYFGIFMQGRAGAKRNAKTILTTMMRDFRSRAVTGRRSMVFDELDAEMQLKKVAAQVAIRKG